MSFKALQHPGEIRALVDLLVDQKVKSYLEIGAKFGGSLWRVGSRLESPAKIVAVDLPNGTRVWPESKCSLEQCATALRRKGHTVDLIWGDSTDDAVIAQVKERAPFDAILIDANHTRPFIEKDWANYGPLGKIIIFHDISWKRDKAWFAANPGRPRIDVPQFWDVIKQSFYHVEIRMDPTGGDNGVGVLWRN